MDTKLWDDAGMNLPAPSLATACLLVAVLIHSPAVRAQAGAACERAALDAGAHNACAVLDFQAADTANTILYGDVMRALSALDIALWGRNARAAGLPLSRYLGGVARDFLGGGGHFVHGRGHLVGTLELVMSTAGHVTGNIAQLAAGTFQLLSVVLQPADSIGKEVTQGVGRPRQAPAMMGDRPVGLCICAMACARAGSMQVPWQVTANDDCCRVHLPLIADTGNSGARVTTRSVPSAAASNSASALIAPPSARR